MKVAVVAAMLATACAHSAYAGTITLFAAKDCKGETLKLTASNSDLEAVKFDNKTNSTLVADGKVYCGDEDGDFVVLAARKEKQILSKMLIAGKEEDGPNLGSPVYSTPVVANGIIYVASNAHLYAIHDAARHAPSSDQPKVDVNPKGLGEKK